MKQKIFLIVIYFKLQKISNEQENIATTLCNEDFKDLRDFEDKNLNTKFRENLQKN